MDRDYLLRRVHAEHQLVRRAASSAAADAHRQMAEHYAARLAALGDGELPQARFFWRRLGTAWPRFVRLGRGWRVREEQATER